MPSAQRLVAFGLAIAAVTILVLAYFVVSDLTREAELHQAAIAAQEVKDHLETLRLALNEVRTVSTGFVNGQSEARGDISASVVNDTMLQLIMTDAPVGSVDLGADITYTWTVTNTGLRTATGVALNGAPQAPVTSTQRSRKSIGFIGKAPYHRLGPWRHERPRSRAIHAIYSAFDWVGKPCRACRTRR